LGDNSSEAGWDLTATILRFLPGDVVIFDRGGGILHRNNIFLNNPCFARDKIADIHKLNRRLARSEAVRQKLEEMFQEALGGKTTAPINLEIACTDGQNEVVEVYMMPIVDSDGAVAAVMLHTIDITGREALRREHQEMEMEYLVASRMAILGELARGIAHNINNPLAGLFGYLELLGEEYPDNEHIAKAIKQCQRIGDIARNLSYHGRNTEQTGSAKINLHELIDETLLLVNASKLYDKVNIVTEKMEDPAIVTANAGDVTQVLLNLLRNARDAVWGMDNGILTIRTAPAGDEIVLSVSDNGEGIPESIRDHIFEPFFSTKERIPTQDLSPSGNGLGLSTSRQRLMQSDGRIDFVTKMNAGTTFRVYLPRARADT